MKDWLKRHVLEVVVTCVFTIIFGIIIAAVWYSKKLRDAAAQECSPYQVISLSENDKYAVCKISEFEAKIVYLK
jgi:predicted negative regulator of RcsB-dependent stress response